MMTLGVILLAIFVLYEFWILGVLWRLNHDIEAYMREVEKVTGKLNLELTRARVLKFKRGKVK